MAQLFRYKAMALSGRKVTGKVEADDQAAAVSLLRSRDFFVVDIKPLRGSEVDLGKLLGLKIKGRDLSVFCRQFATMNEAGIPLLQCLAILIKQTENPTLRRIVIDAAADVEKGQSLSEAFLVHKDRFPEIFINMLIAGEISGTLDQALARIAAYFEKEHQTREKIKSAMTYPLLVAAISVAAIIALLVIVVPIFVDIFASTGASLPLPTLILIAASNFITIYWYTLPLGALALFFGFKKLASTPKGRRSLDLLFLKMPVAGPLVHKTIVSRVSSTLATLLRSGVPLLKSLETIEKVSGNAIAAQEIAAAKESIREGERMSPSLENSQVFPPMAVNMIAIGEESGALDDMLEKLSAFYQQELDTAIGKLSSIIEPLMILGVGLIVAFMALSIYMPLFGLSGAMQGGQMP